MTNTDIAEVIATIDKHLENHYGFDAKELVMKHPPRWTCRNKKLVYNLSCPDAHDSFRGRLEYSRWRQFKLPKQVDKREMEIEIRDDMFDYVPPEDDNTVVWYLNFADCHVFGYYSGRLLAQDELQCLEHPALCSLRESLSSTPFTSATLTTIHTTDGLTLATPILIRGVQRRCRIKTDRNDAEGRHGGLYGNQFAIAKPEVVTRATELFDKRMGNDENEYFSNIIAMEAPKYGSGNYGYGTIKKVLSTAYTGFLAARYESLVEKGVLLRSHDPSKQHTTHNPDAAAFPKVIIHTGNWGCGAFGGSIPIMATLQFFAALVAGVDKVVYHSAGAPSKKQAMYGLDVYTKYLDSCEETVDIDKLAAAVEKMKFQWGFSNGT
ncbi:4289_t:CDS:2 [Paraglomus brasilianum]|uniref:4289_t:CDS:1 n=1 Tax=Paraglomus brasilianum TaxID=144538 RepID=A0A9N9BPE6_9GLOM|nr:4289_t:CDS:2 [Paraglomus brasilianum]